MTRRFLVTNSTLLCLIALALFCTPLSQAAEAQKDGTTSIKLNARSFFDGNFKYGDWLPIEVTLENYGEAVEAQVETTISSPYNGTTFNTTFRREVSLGQRANKRLILYIQPFVQTANVSRNVVYDAKVELKINNQKLDEKSVKLQPLNPSDYLVGALVSDPNVLTGLNNLKVGPQRSRVTAVALNLAEIPDRMEGLRSLNALIISETATDGLTGAQRTALRDWVSTGGQLLLMGGNGWGRVREAFDSSFLPFDVLDFANITDVSSLLPVPGEKALLAKPVAMARGQVLQGARALAFGPPTGNAGPSPMITERRLGGGRVIAVAVDLTAPALLDWSGNSRSWQELFNYNAGSNNALYSEQNPQLKNAADLQAFISSVPDLQVPNLMPFLIIFGIYVLIMSPLNYLVLKRVGRLELAWVTIPLSIAVCTGVTISIANSQPPGQIIISQMSVVQVGPGQDNAQVRSYAALFSPEDRRYQVALEAQEGLTGSLLLPMIRNTNGATENDPAKVVVQGEHSRLDGLQIGQWGAQGFSAETTLPAQKFQLSSDLYFQRDQSLPDNYKIVGTIRNTTNTTIRNALLILGDMPVKLKDEVIDPGEAVKVEFNLPSPTAMAQAYCSNNYGSYGSFPPQTPGDRISNLLRQDRGNQRDDKLMANRAGFLKKIFDSGRYSPINPQRGVDLVGWLDQNPLPISVDDVTVQDKTSQVLIARLPVSGETREGEARFIAPGAYLWPESSSNDAGLSPLTNRTDRLDEVCLTRGSVTVQYRLPTEQTQARVNKLTLYLNSVSTSSQRSPSPPDRVEVYDWQSGKWQLLNNLTNSAVAVTSGNYAPPTPRPNDIPNAARYVEPQTGRILLRFGVDGNGTILTQFNLSAEANR
jgi:hypothetical protein